MYPDRDPLEQQLWELLYELLPEEEAAALRDRIAAEPDVAAAYQRVAGQRELVTESLRWRGGDVPLHPPSEKDHRPAPASSAISASDAPALARSSGRLPRLMRSLQGLACAAAVAMLAVIGYAWLRPGSLLHRDGLAVWKQAAGDHVRLIVSGPREASPAGVSRFTVTTASLESVPRSAEITWRFADLDGDTLARGRARTGEDGVAVLVPPDAAMSGGRLEVAAQGDDAAPISVAFSAAPANREMNLALGRSAPPADRLHWFFAAPEGSPSPELAAGFGGSAGAVALDFAKERAAGDGKAVALEAGDGVFEADEPVQVEVTSNRSDAPLVVAATAEGELVGQAPVLFPPEDRREGAASATVSIPLADSVAGWVHLRAYDYSRDPPEPLAEQLVYRRPSRWLDVIIAEVGAADDEAVGYEIEITDEKGQPVEATLEVAVIESPVSADDGIATAPLALSYADRPKNGAFTAEGEVVDKYDRQVGVTPQMSSSRGLERKSAAPSPPQVADNLAAVWAQAEAEVAALEQRREELGELLGRLSLGGGAVLLIVLLMGGLLRIGFDARLWTPALAATLLLLGIGGALSEGRPAVGRPEPVAFRTPTSDSSPRDAEAATLGESLYIAPAESVAERVELAEAEPMLNLDNLARLEAPEEPSPGSGFAAPSPDEAFAQEKQQVSPPSVAAGRGPPAPEADAAPPLDTFSLRRRRDASSKDDDGSRPEQIAEADATAGLASRAAPARGLQEAEELRQKAEVQLDRRFRYSLGPPAPRSAENADWGIRYQKQRLTTNERGRVLVTVPEAGTTGRRRVIVEAFSPGRAGQAAVDFDH
ncbi:MAG: hypothetical protein KY475_08515 [Planctomycetes bacterium]|nr:hypothetical protein [Planctomycetota bacterium]